MEAADRPRRFVGTRSADPAQYVDYVVAFEGDSVWQAVQARNLQAVVEIHTSGQAPAMIYRAR